MYSNLYMCPHELDFIITTLKKIYNWVVNNRSNTMPSVKLMTFNHNREIVPLLQERHAQKNLLILENII